MFNVRHLKFSAPGVRDSACTMKTKPFKLRLGVLGSGSGTNMQAILEAIDNRQLDAEIVCVISDLPDAGILSRAKAREIPAHYVDPAPYRTKLDGDAEQRCVELLRQAAADTIVLAGFMRIVKPHLLSAFPGRVINIHPALLPAFPGLDAWRQALDYGVKVAGCTVHFVDEGVDTGPIILQHSVPVLDKDTPATLHARIQEEEHKAYPEALRRLASGRLRVTGRRVWLDDDAG